MWGDDAKARAAGALARVLARYASADRVSRAAARVEHWRTVFDEAAGAFWHFTALPSKRDLRLLQRRVSALKQRVEELDQVVAKLEDAITAVEQVEQAERPEQAAPVARPESVAQPPPRRDGS